MRNPSRILHVSKVVDDLADSHYATPPLAAHWPRPPVRRPSAPGQPGHRRGQGDGAGGPPRQAPSREVMPRRRGSRPQGATPRGAAAASACRRRAPDGRVDRRATHPSVSPCHRARRRALIPANDPTVTTRSGTVNPENYGRSEERAWDGKRMIANNGSPDPPQEPKASQVAARGHDRRDRRVGARGLTPCDGGDEPADWRPLRGLRPVLHTGRRRHRRAIRPHGASVCSVTLCAASAKPTRW